MYSSAVWQAREKVTQLYDNYKSLKESRNKQVEKLQMNDNDFLLSLDHLFDIAHEDAM